MVLNTEGWKLRVAGTYLMRTIQALHHSSRYWCSTSGTWTTCTPRQRVLKEAEKNFRKELRKIRGETVDAASCHTASDQAEGCGGMEVAGGPVRSPDNLEVREGVSAT